MTDAHPGNQAPFEGKSVLILGGTRNLGYYAARHFEEGGARVAVLNRGRTADQLPAGIERLRADRTRPVELRSALGRREFDIVIDTTLYTGEDAKEIANLLEGRVGRYLFVSTGQVYLVRIGPERPFREADYEGPIMPEPDRGSADYADWAYGAHKRDAENALAEAWARRRFPVTSLRLPMVNSERDQYERIRNYIARLNDAGPILVPDGPHPRLRHVWVHDVVQAMERLSATDVGLGGAFNVSQDETVTIDDFLTTLAQALGRVCRILRVPREKLAAQGVLPFCSPFSGRWMSELDNERSVREIGIRYTPVSTVIATVVADYLSRPDGPPPAGYALRPRELELA